MALLGTGTTDDDDVIKSPGDLVRGKKIDSLPGEGEGKEVKKCQRETQEMKRTGVKARGNEWGLSSVYFGQ